MAPTPSRRVFVWSLSTIFLLGFLWYKRKKSYLRSDPGGTDLKSIGEIKDCDPSVKKSASGAPVVQDVVRNGTSVIDIEVGKIQTTCVAGIYKEEVLPSSRGVVEESSIDANSNVGKVVVKPGEKRLPFRCGKKSVEAIELAEEKIEESNRPFECESSLGPSVVEEDNKTSVEICVEESCRRAQNTFEGSFTSPTSVPDLISAVDPIGIEVLESLCEERIASDVGAAVRVEFKGKPVETVEKVLFNLTSCLNPNAADFVVSISKDSASEQNYQKSLVAVEFEDIAQCCDFERDKISHVKQITGKVSDSQSSSTPSAAASSRAIIVNQEQAYIACNQDQIVTQAVHTLQDKQVLENNSGQTVLEQDIGLSGKQSWATEVELELKEVTVVDSPPEAEDRSSVAAEMARESSSDVGCESPAIDDGTAERKSSSLESKLSALQLEKSAGQNTAEGVKERRGLERDSANHSPAEVMLESPSISSYSDAQSEGSSDSGKGGSDVATPPSRTPASGSSVAGDLPLPSVYEFVLPQFLVGRLIGRHGLFVHQIKAKTNANIFIKRHPETAKMKICAIEGTQMDIESALDMIRQKFPLKRYPNVSLEQVSFLPPAAAFPLGTDSFMVQLIEGVNNDVIVSSLVTPAHFFLQQPTHPTYPALNRLNVCMSICYSEPTAPVLPSPVAADVVCVAPTMGGWFRAQVVSTDPENGVCDVRFMDYGGYLTVEYSALRQIRQDFLTLPFQAAECYLANVKPVNGVWTQDAMAYVEELTHGQVIQAQIYGYAENGVPAIYLFSIQGSKVVVVNQELVSRGYAEFEEPAEETVAAPVEGQALTAV